MYELRVVSQFAAAHQLRGFEGGCENLHGHNWKVEVYVTGNKLEQDGLLIDFRVIKEKTETLLEKLDHKLLNDLDPFLTLNPSSENIARHLFESLSSEFNNQNVRVNKITVWESDTACASYTAS